MFTSPSSADATTVAATYDDPDGADDTFAIAAGNSGGRSPLTLAPARWWRAAWRWTSKI